MTRRRRFLPGFIIVLCIVLGGCVGVSERSAPAWIDDSSGPTPDGERLIAYGSGSNTILAEEELRRDLHVQVARVLIKIVESRGYFESNELSAHIDQIAAERSRNLPGDVFRRRGREGRIEIFARALYDDRTIAEDSALIDLVIADLPSIRGPGSHELVWTEIVTKMVSDPPESYELQFERLAEVAAYLESITLLLSPEISTVSLGELRSPTFITEFEFLTIPSSDDRAVRTELRFVETAPSYDGQRTERESLVAIESAQTETISAAPPDLSGVWQYRVEPPWLEESLDRWTGAILEETERRRSVLLGLLEQIEELLVSRAAIEVTTEAAEIPTAVVILDRDIAGNPIAGDTAGRSTARRLDDLGFRIRVVELDDESRRELSLRSRLDVEELYDILPFDVLSIVDRVVVGRADIVAFDEGESFSVEVLLEAEVFDLRRDRRLANVSIAERTAGGDAPSAIRAAFSSAGRRTADLIAPRLP